MGLSLSHSALRVPWTRFCISSLEMRLLLLQASIISHLIASSGSLLAAPGCFILPFSLSSFVFLSSHSALGCFILPFSLSSFVFLSSHSALGCFILPFCLLCLLFLSFAERLIVSSAVLEIVPIASTPASILSADLEVLLSNTTFGNDVALFGNSSASIRVLSPPTATVIVPAQSAGKHLA
jgi:hypothetical protein